MPDFSRVIELANTFPSLAKRNVKSPTDLQSIAADCTSGAGVRQAAGFCYWVWTAGGGGWNFFDAWGRWDDAHRAAWRAWAADPWMG